MKITFTIEKDDGTTTTLATCRPVNSESKGPMIADSDHSALQALTLREASGVWTMCRAMCVTWLPLRPQDMERLIDVHIVEAAAAAREDTNRLAERLWLASRTHKNTGQAEPDTSKWETLDHDERSRWVAVAGAAQSKPRFSVGML